MKLLLKKTAVSILANQIKFEVKNLKGNFLSIREGWLKLHQGLVCKKIVLELVDIILIAEPKKTNKKDKWVEVLFYIPSLF